MNRPVPTQGAWRRDVDAKALRAWAGADLAAIAGVMREPLSAWKREWGVGGDDGVSCRSVCDASGTAAWQPLGARGEAAAWSARQAEFAGRVHEDLFGTGSVRGTIASEVTAQCAADLLARMAARLELTPSPLPLPALHAWSGAVEVTLFGDLLLLLNASAAQVIVPVRVPASPVLHSVAPLQRALAQSPIDVQVRLQGCDLDLACLQDLRIGDVVRTAHAIERPAQVRSRSGDPLFDGFLARSGARKAVELSAASVP